jgi:hypothetical protein
MLKKPAYTFKTEEMLHDVGTSKCYMFEGKLLFTFKKIGLTYSQEKKSFTA